jgi:hypothetical protein
MASFKDNVLKECAEKFYDEEFVSVLNCNAYLVGVSNGVLDLQSTETGAKDGRPHVQFRPGKPDDNISFQMGRSEPDMDAIPYIPYDAESQDQKDLMEFFYDVLYLSYITKSARSTHLPRVEDKSKENPKQQLESASKVFLLSNRIKGYNSSYLSAFDITSRRKRA